MSQTEQSSVACGEELWSTAERCLRDRFGHDTFRPGQREVIEHLLAGRSAAAVFPTGAGKSLCYQLPALLLPGITVVVSPLIALMKDQIDRLATRGVEAVRLDSTLSSAAYREAVQRVRNGHCKLLYASPERFQNERFWGFVQQLRISLFAVDEAHCISEWGHNFRPDYLKLARLATACRAERRFALTATATEKVLDDICEAFSIAPQCAVRTPFYRPNLNLQVTGVTTSNRDAVLMQRMEDRPRGATIVYVTQQRTAEQVAGMLAARGFPARAYHAGLATPLREETQEWFLREQQPIIVATIAFGMGIDKRDIRYVYHYNLSKSLENYAQEIGRAGRDDRPSICETLACTSDLRILENFAFGDTPSAAAVHALLAEVFSSGPEFSVSIYELSHKHDIKDLVVRTLLTYLELDGYLRGGTPFYATYQFQPLKSSAEILAYFDGERKTFLANLLKTANKAKTWFYLDVERAMRYTGADRQRVVAAIDYLGTQGWLKVEVSGLRYAYHRLRAPDDLHALGETLYQRVLTREQREVERLRQMVHMLTDGGCSVLQLTGHFDDSLTNDCGQCSGCQRQGQSLVLPPSCEEPTLGPKSWKIVAELRRDFGQVLTDPRIVTRFLCGLSSPWLVQAKLTSHELYGTQSHVPFEKLMAQVSQHTG